MAKMHPLEHLLQALICVAIVSIVIFIYWLFR